MGQGVVLMPQVKMMVAVVVVLAGLYIFMLSLQRCWCNEDRRRRCSSRPMGLGGDRRCRLCRIYKLCRHKKKSTGRIRSHGILDVRPFAGGTVSDGLDRYVHSLGRGPRRTMRKQIDAVFKAKGIVHQWQPVAAHALGWEHLAVCIAHQRRQSRGWCNLPLSITLGAMRFLVASFMTGGLDEFREPLIFAQGGRMGSGRLIAWSQPIAKGSTLRGMWYYCRPEHDRSCVWFFTVRLNITRALRAGLSHVDAGPSDNETVASLKKKYGFDIDGNWRETVNYEGEFVELGGGEEDGGLGGKNTAPASRGKRWEIEPIQKTKKKKKKI